MRPKLVVSKRQVTTRHHLVVKIEDWSQIHEIAALSTLWAFRGHSVSRWHLETNIYRGAAATGRETKKLANREDWMLYQFQRRAHHYLRDLPPAKARLDWLALMQHYGAPTRLLDFSHSIYVAAFFAVERGLTDAAIWGVNLFALMSRKPDVWKGRIDAVNRQQVALANDVIRRKRRVAPDVLSVEPERMHERLVVQQGLFLFPCDITSSFEANLGAALKAKADFLRNMRTQQWRTGDYSDADFATLRTIKIVVPPKLFASAMENLDSMNVNSATLFPGLDGFARSLYYHLL